jgi:hypothetical protein
LCGSMRPCELTVIAELERRPPTRRDLRGPVRPRRPAVPECSTRIRSRTGASARKDMPLRGQRR